MKLFLQIIFLLYASIGFSQSGWVRQSEALGGHSVHFENQNTGWIVGSGGIIQKTTNGGTNWFMQYSGTSRYLFNVSFSSLNTGYVIGDSGLIIKSTNGGENWLRQNSGTTSILRAQALINDNIIYVVGSNNAFLKTTNGGINWFSLSLGNSIEVGVFDIKFIDQYIGWTTGTVLQSHHHKIFKTTDGGKNWISLFDFGKTDLITSVFYNDENYGFLSLANGAVALTSILNTNDGGINWIPSNTSSGSYSFIFFTDFNNGWHVGPSNQIYYTSNSGESWTIQSIPPLPLIDFYSCYFVDSLTGWAVGGAIYKTTSGGVLTNFTNSSTEIPDEYFLSQNYPNPFNPVTNLEFGISKLGFVSVKVYDVLGNIVSILVKENKPAGSYEIEFDGSDFASGIYFYRLEVDGNHIDTKRMILLK